MVAWFLPPNRPGKYSPLADRDLIKALNALLEVESPGALYNVLKRWQQLLFSEPALMALCLTGAQERLRGDQQLADDLQDMLSMLAYTRARGTAAVLSQLRSLQQNQDDADTGLMNDEAPEVAQTRHIKLLTQAIASISPADTPMLWAELHVERAYDALQIAPTTDSVGQTEQAITDYSAALSILTLEETPSRWANAHMLRGLAYRERNIGDATDNIEQAIADFNAALQFFTREHTAMEWAIVHAERGLAYQFRTIGTREENLARAVADFDAALLIITREEEPIEWARAMMYRIDANVERGGGGTPAEKNEQAILDYSHVLEVITFENMPNQWLNAHANRGIAYSERTEGDRIQNLSLAIADFDAYLATPIRASSTIRWAHILNMRGAAYIEFAQGQQERIQQAIADFDAALEVFTRESTPLEWALTRLNRGRAYREQSYKEQAGNLEQAIAEFDAALEILTISETPQEWAETHVNRGLSYTERMYGERSENIERAIADQNEALHVLTPDTNIYEYGLVQLNLGFAYIMRIRGQRVENLEQALTYLNRALEVLTAETHPREWALTLMNRGLVYLEYPLGERAENLQLAIRDNDQAMTVFTREKASIDWARAALNRTLAYTNLVIEYHKENLDNAINDYNAILEVLTKETVPHFWVTAIMNRGIAYQHRSFGIEADNIEQALADFNAALEVCNRETMFQSWVIAHVNRGFAYTLRIQGDSADNQDRAIADYDTVLSALTREQMPHYWALTYKNRAAVYLDRLHGDPAQNGRRALSDCQAAITVLTQETSPRDYRDLQLMIAQVYEREGRWSQACSTLQEARKTIQMLVETATSEERRREIIGERDKSSIHVRYAQALLRCEPPAITAAVCALEEGRAQNLRTTLNLDSINLDEMSDPAARARAEAFLAARDAWQQAQLLVTDTEFINLDPVQGQAKYAYQHPTVRAARMAFVDARDAIRRHDDPHFLSPDVALEDILRAIPTPGMALVYLVALEESGMAFIVLRTADSSPHLEHIPLPQLTRKAVLRLLLGVEEPPPAKLMQVIGGQHEVFFLSSGLWMGQLGQTFELLTMWGDNLSEAMQALPKDSTYLEAAQHWLEQNIDPAAQEQFLHQRFDSYPIDKRLALGAFFSNLVINAELKRSLPKLGELGLNRVAEALSKHDIQDVTLIPYGHLSQFPLPAALVQLPSGNTKHLNALFTVTVAPSARAKEMALSRAGNRTGRPFLLTVGNPQPLPAGKSDLPYAQAEADTIRRLAQAYHYPDEHIRYLSLTKATRKLVVEALEKSRYAHLAIHGQYDVANPRRSRLILAGNNALREDQRSIYLSEALDGKVNLGGLRLLVLSACETGLIDTYYAPDEVLGLAAGFLQAGAAGVIASLWAVDDRATYLLMSRFAQLYLDPACPVSPAHALAEAQRWLREEATNAVLMTYNPVAQVQQLTNTPASTTLVSEAVEREGEFRASALRSLRYNHQSGLSEMHLQAAIRATQDPDALPYADPIYWAGFVVTGC